MLSYCDILHTIILCNIHTMTYCNDYDYNVIDIETRPLEGGADGGEGTLQSLGGRGGNSYNM